MVPAFFGNYHSDFLGNADAQVYSSWHKLHGRPAGDDLASVIFHNADDYDNLQKRVASSTQVVTSCKAPTKLPSYPGMA